MGGIQPCYMGTSHDCHGWYITMLHGYATQLSWVVYNHATWVHHMTVMGGIQPCYIGKPHNCVKAGIQYTDKIEEFGL